MGASKAVHPGGEIEKRRKQFTPDNVRNVLNACAAKWEFRLTQKGYSGSTSRHEVLGIIQEEVHEFCIEVFGTDNKAKVREELIDIVVACMWGLASMDADTTDW